MAEKENHYYQPEVVEEKAHITNAPLCPDLIKDLQDIHADTPWEDGDLQQVLITVPPEYFHQAVGIGVLFDELSRFTKDGGFYVTKRSLRVLQQECKIPAEIMENPQQLKEGLF